MKLRFAALGGVLAGLVLWTLAAMRIDHAPSFDAMPMHRRLSLLPEAWAARNGSGTMSLYSPGNPVVTGTTVGSSWANNTLNDIATEITDSLNRSGKGGMLAALRLTNGAVGAPSLSFTSETTSGLFRNAASDIRMAVGGAYFQKWTSTGTLVTSNTSGAQATNTSLSMLDTDSYGLFTYPRLTANSFNLLTQTGDTGLFFGHVVDSTDALVIGPWSASSKGLRIASTGAVTTSGAVTAGGALTVSTGGANITGGITLPDASPTITSSSTTTSTTFSSPQASGTTTPAWIFNTSSARSSGDPIIDLRNNGTSRFKVDAVGLITLGGSAGAAQIALDSSSSDNGQITAGSLILSGAGGKYILISATTQASLGAPSNGTFRYCSDCTIANPCAGGGTGAFAKRLNGAWVCN